MHEYQIKICSYIQCRYFNLLHTVYKTDSLGYMNDYIKETKNNSTVKIINIVMKQRQRTAES